MYFTRQRNLKIVCIKCNTKDTKVFIRFLKQETLLTGISSKKYSNWKGSEIETNNYILQKLCAFLIGSKIRVFQYISRFNGDMIKLKCLVSHSSFLFCRRTYVMKVFLHAENF